MRSPKPDRSTLLCLLLLVWVFNKSRSGPSPAPTSCFSSSRLALSILAPWAGGFYCFKVAEFGCVGCWAVYFL